MSTSLSPRLRRTREEELVESRVRRLIKTYNVWKKYQSSPSTVHHPTCTPQCTLLSLGNVCICVHSGQVVAQRDERPHVCPGPFSSSSPPPCLVAVKHGWTCTLSDRFFDDLPLVDPPAFLQVTGP